MFTRDNESEIYSFAESKVFILRQELMYSAELRVGAIFPGYFTRAKISRKLRQLLQIHQKYSILMFFISNCNSNEKFKESRKLIKASSHKLLNYHSESCRAFVVYIDQT